MEICWVLKTKSDYNMQIILVELALNIKIS